MMESDLNIIHNILKKYTAEGWFEFHIYFSKDYIDEFLIRKVDHGGRRVQKITSPVLETWKRAKVHRYKKDGLSKY